MAIKLEDIGLLIIGYDRPELLKNRVMDLANTYIPNVYISINGGERSHTPEMLNTLEFARSNLSYANLNITHHKNNQGAVNHIVSQITRVLSIHKYIIYLDDDIKLSANFITNIIRGLEFLSNKNLKGVVTGHSRIFSKRFSNKWRKVNMAYPQGCSFSVSTWSGFQKNISPQEIELELNKSQKWINLNRFQKHFWLSKFTNVAHNPNHTWDYQFTFHCFINNFTIIAPIFSIVGNEGYGYATALHTRGKKPRAIKNDQINEQIITSFSKFNKLHQIFEIDNVYVRSVNKFKKEVKKLFVFLTGKHSSYVKIN